MLDIGWSELVLIAVIALIVIGPKELPGVLRMVGQWTGKVRRMAAEFQGQFNEALREAEMVDLKKQVDDIAETARGLTRFDPLADLPSKPFAELDKPPAEPGKPDEIVGAGEPALVDTAAAQPALPAVNETVGEASAPAQPPDAGDTDSAPPVTPAPPALGAPEPVSPSIESGESGANASAEPANAGAPSTEPRPQS